MACALTIAGMDPSGGAGIQADIKTFQSFGVADLSVTTALTAQNTKGIYQIHEVPVQFILAQLDAVFEDRKPQALKTGMLFSAKAVQAIASKLMSFHVKKLIVDPVMISTTGTNLMEEGVHEKIKNHLIPISYMVMPNIPEASELSHIAIHNVGKMKQAALAIQKMGSEAVLIKGGHLPGKPVDILWNGKEFTFFEGEREAGQFHGTGCVLSAAVTACLAKGYDLKESIGKAKAFLYRAMKSSLSTGEGLKILNMRFQSAEV